MNQQKKRPHLSSERGNGEPGRRASPVGSPQVELTNPEPDDSPVTWELAGRLALLLIAGVVAVVALYLARSVLMPVAAALLIGITLRPIQMHLARYRIPAALTAVILVVAFLAAVYYLVHILVGSLTEWIAQAPDIGNVIREKLRWLGGPLETVRDLQKVIAGSTGDTAPKVALETSMPGMLQSAASVVTPAVSELLVFVGTLLFFMIGTEHLRRQLITLFDTRDARLTVVRIWNDVEQNLVSYVGTVTLINAGLAVVTMALLYALGFPNPIAFGALCFVLNYAPYVGPALMIVILAAVGLVTYPTLGGALLPPLLFLGLTTVEGQIITPSIIGHRLTLSPFLVFLALAFWTWLWGPLGTFMATPLLIVGLVVLGHLFPRDEVSLPK